jgi:hypothetical protein
MQPRTEPGGREEGPVVPARPSPRDFSLTRGGPFYTLLGRAALLSPQGTPRGLRIALAVWVPLAVGEILRLAWGLDVSPLFKDISVHTRLLVALPVLLLSERTLDAACASSIRNLYNGGFCERALLDRVVASGERLRDRVLPELVLALVAFAFGQLTLWQVTGATGLFSGAQDAGALSFPRLWYGAVALPLMQFVMLRWLWRWAIWSWMLVRFASLELKLIASHPDHSAGLGCLSKPLSPFAAFALASASVLAGAWGTQISGQRLTAQQEAPAILTLLVALTLVAIVPLLFFSGHLYWARRKSLTQFADFANEYARAFNARWLARGAGAEALGSSDIQAFNDLVGTYATVSKTTLFAFGMRALIGIWVATLLPMAPLFSSGVQAEHILKRLVSTLFTGMPL